MIKPSKEKIEKLLRGTREDAILALKLIVDYFDPVEYLRDNEDFQFLQVIYDEDWDKSRPIWILNRKASTYFRGLHENEFYYQYAPGLYILYTPDAISICYENYSSNLPVIKH